MSIKMLLWTGLAEDELLLWVWAPFFGVLTCSASWENMQHDQATQTHYATKSPVPLPHTWPQCFLCHFGLLSERSSQNLTLRELFFSPLFTLIYNDIKSLFKFSLLLSIDMLCVRECIFVILKSLHVKIKSYLLYIQFVPFHA